MNRFTPTALLALLFFAFFSLLTTFIEGIYTLGLLGVEIPPEIAAVALLLLPLLLLAFPGWLRDHPRRLALLTCAGALVCLAASPLLPTRARMLASGLGAGLFLLGLPALLRRGWGAPALGGGMALAALLAAALRAAHSGSALLREPLWLGALWLAALAGLLLLRKLPADDAAAEDAAQAAPHATRLYLGLTGALLLFQYGLAAPGVMSRWIGGSYALVSAGALLALALFVVLWLAVPRFAALLAPRPLLIGLVLFALALVLAVLPHQPAFPSDPAGYPLAAPQPGLLPALALGLALLLHPLVYAAAARLADSLRHAPPRALAGAASISAGVLLLGILAHVFTTVYDYIPVIGPLFRDRFWLVTVLPAVILAAAVPAARPASHRDAPASRRAAPPPTPGWAALLPVLALLALAGVLAAMRVRPPAAPGPDSVRVLTYNIQQGYDAQGENAYARQLAAIQAQNPDIVGLQENDTTRIANGNNHVTRYLADALGFYVYNGPTSTSGTFGLALLSRYPIENPRTFFLSSEGEQTAAILAEIDTGAKRYTVLVTHLGNGGPQVQQEQVLALLDGRENVVAMGDFNFRPDSEQYALTTGQYANAWEVAVEQLPPPEGFSIARRIDHVFLSTNLTALQALYLPAGPSDHPALVVEVE